MKVSTVQSRGQVTIPQKIRQQYRIGEGSQVIFTSVDEQTIMLTVIPAISVNQSGTGIGTTKRIPCQVVGAKISR